MVLSIQLNKYHDILFFKDVSVPTKYSHLSCSVTNFKQIIE